MKTSRYFFLILIGLFIFSCEKTEFYNPYTQLQEDIAKIDAYLEENNIQAKQSSSGLRYVIHNEGIGSNPIRGSVITVHYTGTLLDGTKFDSSYDRGEPITYTHGAGDVIQGWDEGLSYLGERGKITLYVPSVLAYGRSSRGDVIGPNENLIFDIELLSVQ